MIPGVQPKIELRMSTLKWELLRLDDKLTKQAEDILWLEWNEDGSFKSHHKQIEVGRSLLMSPFNDLYTWQTTDVTEIIKDTEDYIKFKTKNSTYELYKIKDKVLKNFEDKANEIIDNSTKEDLKDYYDKQK